MKKRRVSAVGGLCITVLIVALIGVAFAVSGGRSTSGSHLSSANSVARIRARNLRLQSMIILLTERQVQGVGGGNSLARQPAERVAQVISHRTEPEASAAEASLVESECDPNYEGACLDPNASDYDCAGGSGDGPDYTGEVTVVGDDHFGLDADGDGIGCESE